MYADHPVFGAGLGAQPYESQQLDDRPAQEERYVSHTTPLTVAAELGTIGLALYAALLLGAVRLVQRVYRDAPALGLSLAAALLALFVHSLFYSGFFEDPLTWLALAIAASYLGARVCDRVGGAAPCPRSVVRRERIDGGALWVLLGVLATLGLLTMPYLGADAWPFRPPTVDPRGILGPLVRAADEEWDLGLIRPRPCSRSCSSHSPRQWPCASAPGALSPRPRSRSA